MKKVYLQKVKQNSHVYYSGVLPARDLVKLATRKEFDHPQDAQRPIDARRLEEISSFVYNDGSLSTSIVIGTCNKDRLVVKSEDVPGYGNMYYMEFPETLEEFDSYKDSFDTMDGQHRLFSFLPEYIKIDDYTDFDISFEMYETPTLRERQLIFKNTNEKQKSVPSNLLLWFRQQLGMLSEKEKLYHPVVELLNRETCSPLKGRIIMGAEKNSGGLKAEQIISILDKSDVKHLGAKELDDDQMLKLLSVYLSSWEAAVGTKFVDRDRKYGPFSKIAGFRFMILMLPTFYDKAVSDSIKWNQDNIKKVILDLFASKQMVPGDLFDKNSDYIKSLGGNPFGGETPITELAKMWSHALKSLASENFNPLDDN